ncbi:unnamed protein product [Mytilus coruscus]|uniref:Uncharacterized protein n=1 Tax=Mytilus coruscus TaxID=42192 RepID=A0A6J8ES27_MYTCO|nr:unnamed protein product [Mytilus coruscus]
MFLGKISSDNNKILLNVLDSNRCDGIDGLIRNLYPQDNGHHRLFSTQRESSFIMLDLLFFLLSDLGFCSLNEISQCWKTLEFIKYLLKSKLITFIVDVCKYHHAEISHYAAQVLSTPTVTTERYYIDKLCHRHLQDGIKTEVGSGWLLYGSFYYVSMQFNVTLKLTDYVMSRSSPDMVPIGCHRYDDRHISYYRNHVNSTMTLHDKMRMAVVNMVKYVQNSSLIPKELQQEVKGQFISISPSVMSHCLRFLCYHHIDEIINRQQALRDLYSTVKGNTLITTNTLSNSIAILGVCFEIADDKNTAYQCYGEALQCDSLICATAEARRSNLLTC